MSLGTGEFERLRLLQDLGVSNDYYGLFRGDGTRKPPETRSCCCRASSKESAVIGEVARSIWMTRTDDEHRTQHNRTSPCGSGTASGAGGPSGSLETQASVF